MIVACLVMVSPNSRQSLKGFSVPGLESRAAFFCCWRLSSAAWPPSPVRRRGSWRRRGVGTGEEATADAGEEGVCAEAVGPVDGEVGLAGGEDAGTLVCWLKSTRAAHGVVHSGEYLHGDVAWIVADELLVDFENAFELAVEGFAVDVGEVKVDHGLSVQAEAQFVNDAMDGAGGDVAGTRLPYLGYHSSRK